MSDAKPLAKAFLTSAIAATEKYLEPGSSVIFALNKVEKIPVEDWHTIFQELRGSLDGGLTQLTPFRMGPVYDDSTRGYIGYVPFEMMPLSRRLDHMFGRRALFNICSSWQLAAPHRVNKSQAIIIAKAHDGSPLRKTPTTFVDLGRFFDHTPNARNMPASAGVPFDYNPQGQPFLWSGEAVHFVESYFKAYFDGVIQWQ